MKEFRKNEQGLFICEECGELFKICSTLSYHVGLKHNKREYFDKWIKEKHDGVCLHCGNETAYKNRWDRGYDLFCSKKCKKDFGMPEEAKKLMKISLKKTCNEKYGCDAYTQSDDFKQKIFKKYGVENPSQNSEIIHRIFKTEKKIKKFNENIWYQGSYEFDFLNKYYHTLDIKRGPTIKYQFEGSHVYHPDFYIPSLNLIVECKNSYLLSKYCDNIKAKEKATISNGFNYILIVDKKYQEFDNYLQYASAV